MRYSTAYRAVTTVQWVLAYGCAYFALSAQTALDFWPMWGMAWYNGYYATR